GCAATLGKLGQYKDVPGNVAQRCPTTREGPVGLKFDISLEVPDSDVGSAVICVAIRAEYDNAVPTRSVLSRIGRIHLVLGWRVLSRRVKPLGNILDVLGTLLKERVPEGTIDEH